MTTRANRVRYMLIVVIALVLGIGTFGSRTLYNVTPCIETAGCNTDSGKHGNLTTKQWGFPAVYRQTSTFTVKDQGNYMVSRRTTQNVNVVLILANLFFWFMILKTISDTIASRSKPTKDVVQHD